MKSKITFFVLAVVVLLSAVGLAYYFYNNKPVPQKNEQVHPTIFVKTASVENKIITVDLSYPGRVSPYEEVALAAEVSGRIMEGDVPFKVGESFKKGDLLIHLFNEDVKVAIKASKSNFLQTLSIALPDLSYDFSEQWEKWNAFFSLLDVNNPLPELPEITTEKEEVFLASRGILTSYYSIRQQEINLQKYNLYAPFDGYFKRLNRGVGAVAGMGSELASIVRSDRLEIVVPVLVSDVRMIDIGEKCKISVDDIEPQTGTVSRIAQFVDANTQSVNIYLKYIPPTKGAFLEGEFVTISFVGEAVGMKIPREAVMSDNTVFVLENEKLITKSIEIIHQLDDYVIVKGLKDEVDVVVESIIDISSNTIVKSRK